MGLRAALALAAALLASCSGDGATTPGPPATPTPSPTPPAVPGLVDGASTDGTVAFWDAATGAKGQQFAWKVGPLYAVAFAPDGLRCAALGEYQVVVWDVE